MTHIRGARWIGMLGGCLCACLLLAARVHARQTSPVQRVRPATYTMTLVQESRPGHVPGRQPALYPNLPIYPGLARLQATVSADRGKWSDTQQWLIAPPAGYTSLARIDTAPLPNITASDGYTMWMSDPTRRGVTVYPRDPAGTWPSTEGTLKRFTTYRTLHDLLHDRCTPAALMGSSVVAGRSVYVIRLLPSPCPRPPDSRVGNTTPANWEVGRVVAWVDKATFFTLRLDQYFKNYPGRVMVRDYVTSIQYNVPLDPALFQLAVPPGYRLIRGR